MLLQEAMSTVRNQTVHCEHLISVDASISVAEARNSLVAQATTEWVGFLDDDDLLLPDHVRTLVTHGNDADVVIPHCRFRGPRLPRCRCCQGYCNRPYDREALRRHGIFPITVLARRSAILAVGGFPVGPGRFEDWEMWNAMADNGARFVVVPQATWVYRRGHASRTGALHRGEA